MKRNWIRKNGDVWNNDKEEEEEEEEDKLWFFIKGKDMIDDAHVWVLRVENSYCFENDLTDQVTRVVRSRVLVRVTSGWDRMRFMGESRKYPRKRFC